MNARGDRSCSAGLVPFRSLGAYLLISFGLSWTILALLLFPAELESIFGRLGAGNPLFILGVYSPALAAKGTAFDPLPYAGTEELLMTFGLLLGCVWAVWHLPAFFLSGSPQSDWSFPAFLIGATAAVVVTWIHRDTMFGVGDHAVIDVIPTRPIRESPESWR